MYRKPKPTTISMKKRHAWQHAVQMVAKILLEAENANLSLRELSLDYKRAEQSDQRRVIETALS